MQSLSVLWQEKDKEVGPSIYALDTLCTLLLSPDTKLDMPMCEVTELLVAGSCETNYI